ncbi:lysophospholipase L1-like esterase [Dyadobacter jejuensis]|uniref:Lysophospholipase L1-like esterase n=1 Tax=Dyadobacter jejuensis TaxID=1082580 RepID=A0A316AIW6_9BACT|nr:SGNH/GDSL hydrolase family protein [Dyadobacter jejuensis]PWJ57745.1 lysophospholipase L1-like esterase [Dyadobacter jejuensis]
MKYIFKRTLFRIAVLLFLVPVQVFSQNKTEPIFKDGDTVCFVGNSITNNALFYNYINLFYATRYPERKVKFVNCGISGDVTQGILNRMDSDILVHNPSWSVLMIGMNDVSRSLYAKSRQNEPGIKEKQAQALDKYRKNLELVVARLLENGRKVIIENPTIYDQTGDLPTENFFGVNEALRKCADYGEELAKKYQLPTVDYWTTLLEVNKKVQEKDKTATIIGNDRVHPGSPGHLIMAYEFLKSTGASPYVSKMVVHKKAAKRNSNSLNCTIENVAYSKNGLQFEAKEEALPFPVGQDALAALSLVPFTDRLNQEILQVEDLATGEYDLLIDQVLVGTYPSQELKKGVNLALENKTPQYQRAAKIRDLYAEYRRNQLKYRNIVSIEIHHLTDSLKTAPMDQREAALTKRLNDKYEEGTGTYQYHKSQYKSYLENKLNESTIKAALTDLVTEVYASNKPVTHTYELVRK